MKKFLFLMLVTFYYVWGDTPVLIVHSYHESYSWTQKQREGFVSVLNSTKDIYPLYSTEYLDTKRRVFDQEYEDEFVHYMRAKYKGYHPKLIYVTDDDAFHFILDNQDKLFPGVRVVFSGVNDLSKKKSINRRTYSGVFEKKEIKPNLRLIKSLFPKEREVFIVGDGSLTAKAIHKELKNDITTVAGLKAQCVNEQQFDVVLEKLRDFKGKTVVLTTIGGFLTRNGNLMPLDEVIHQIHKAGPFVIFSLEDTYIQDGVIGGYVVDGISEGREAGQLALQILAYPGAVLSIFDNNTRKWIFDAEALAAQKITLPKEIREQSTFLNLPETFFDKHHEWFILLLYGLSATVIIGSSLYGWLMYRSRTIIAQRESALSAISKRLNQAQQISHLGNWEWDIQANTIWWSDEIYRIFGLEPQQFRATYEGFLERVHPEDRELIESAVMNTFEHDNGYS
ncbi:MAG TPA: PAS domain-containing protein, partial [Sulfuricurvum sp.]|nr:PAS domain-containing protein [Sulfuricurvum sp.]